MDLAYREACERASQQLLGNPDINGLCLNSGAVLVKGTDKTLLIALDYLGCTCHISLPELEFTYQSSTPLTPRDKLIILHYLNTASGVPLTGKLITFQQLPEGLAYHPTFIKRAVKPVMDSFIPNPDRLLAACQKFGGGRSAVGKISAGLKALPYVPLVFTLWPGDEELPPSGSILFDSSISSYLPAEDITVLCEIVAWKLVKLNREIPLPASGD